jgi:hypothetical protein
LPGLDPDGLRVEAAQPLAAPERWLQEVEEIVFQRYSILPDKEDEVD